MRSVEFSNTAHSLSRMQVERLFDHFYTVEAVQSSTDLGLSIAKLLTKNRRKYHSCLQNDTLTIRVAVPKSRETIK